jgi:hypothetical protein
MDSDSSMRSAQSAVTLAGIEFVHNPRLEPARTGANPTPRDGTAMNGHPEGEKQIPCGNDKQKKRDSKSKCGDSSASPQNDTVGNQAE